MVVTCTNGEYGDGPDHVKPGEAGPRPGPGRQGPAGRAKAWRASSSGVTHLELLGYHDSGMADWAYKEHRTCSANLPLEESAATAGGPGGALPARRHRHLLRHGRPQPPGPPPGPSHSTEAPRAPASRPSSTSSPAGCRDWDKLRERMQAAGLEVPPATEDARPRRGAGDGARQRSASPRPSTPSRRRPQTGRLGCPRQPAGPVVVGHACRMTPSWRSSARRPSSRPRTAPGHRYPRTTSSPVCGDSLRKLAACRKQGVPRCPCSELHG